MAINITESCLLIYGTATEKLVPDSTTTTTQVWTNHHREYIKSRKKKKITQSSKAVATHGLFLPGWVGVINLVVFQRSPKNTSSVSNSVTSGRKCFHNNNNNSSSFTLVRDTKWIATSACRLGHLEWPFTFHRFPFCFPIPSCFWLACVILVQWESSVSHFVYLEGRAREINKTKKHVFQ